jgi:prophage regulatory protein
MEDPRKIVPLDSHSCDLGRFTQVVKHPEQAVVTELQRRLGGHMSETILRPAQVRLKTGLGRTAIYERVRAGKFPKPITLGSGARAVGYLQSEVDQWIADRVAESRRGNK